MAFSKKHKSELIDQYEDWLRKSQAVFMIEYGKMSMKEIDTLRAKVRDAGGQLHVVKNALFEQALDKTGFHHSTLAKTTLAGFAIKDVPALAKLFVDTTNKSEVYKLKGGFIDGIQIKAEQVKILASLPPLPVMRAQLLGVIMAPATKVARILAEPARQVAYVVKAYSEKEAAPAAE